MPVPCAQAKFPRREAATDGYGQRRAAADGNPTTGLANETRLFSIYLFFDSVLSH